MPGWFSLFLWRYPLREARRRPLRSLLTLLGIVLGVAAVASVQLGLAITHQAYSGMFRSLGGRADLEVVSATGQGTFPPELTVLEGISGVRAAVPSLQVPAGLASASGPVPILLLGIDPLRDSLVRDLTLVEGSFPNGPGILLEAAFAARHGCTLGKSARLMTARGPVELPVRGLLAAQGPAQFNGGAIGVVPLAVAQATCGHAGEVSSVLLLLEAGASVETIRQSIEERMPGRTARAPGEGGKLADDFLLSIDQGLRSLSAVAIVTGALVILNTVLMNLGERQRQLALLRALGATRRQVTGMFVRQALFLGCLGTVLGLPVGILLAFLLVRVNESYLGLPLPGPHLHLGPLLLAGALGPAMTLVAAIGPARQAVRREPLEGLRARGGTGLEPWSYWPIVLGVVLIGGLIGFETGIVRGWLTPEQATPFMPLGIGATVVGCACLLPLFLPGLLRGAGLIVPRFLGVEGRLAIRQLLRQRARTGVTVGVLFAAVTASVSFGMSFQNNLGDIRAWYTHTIDPDFLVRAVRPDPAVVVTPAPLPVHVREDVQRLPGCADASRFRFDPTRIAGQSVLVISRDFPDAYPLPLLLHAGDPDVVRSALARGETVLGSALAGRLGVGVGDTISLTTRAGPRKVRVAGIAKEYTVGGMVLYVDWKAASQWFGFVEAHGLAILAQRGEEEVLGAALVDYCGRHGVLLERNADFAASVERVASGVLSLVAGLVALVFLVAALGVVNTLSTNVLDQTRELGVLRALGMKRGQIRKLVLAQALTLALVSVVPGAPAGILLAWLMNLATPGLLGHVVAFQVEWWFVLLCVLGVSILAVGAALLPARRAANLAVVDALRYE